MARFKLLGGNFMDEKGRTFKKGDVVKSSADLTKIFINSFERLHEDEADGQPGTASKVAKGATAPKPNDKSKTSTVKPDKAKSARGEDKTEAFPLALEHGLTVCLRGELYHVYEGDETTPLNKTEGGLKKAAAEAFVKSYLEE